ncbi:uncharacterized protein UV8b_05625 [Ustilaginoidea virens]|uniref:Uncharacterized protein n=1 Tax=Ustilaginoidea virens TaxID=1159556 RepID=A0A8E5MJ92_USTVR|nr:uncharacterized protein UV8b_05625 [Ustilaginoidea virens]QUC21382.1 hypothetical protein UV8b_05625 [Ustilaginoidea virens]
MPWAALNAPTSIPDFWDDRDADHILGNLARKCGVEARHEYRLFITRTTSFITFTNTALHQGRLQVSSPATSPAAASHVQSRDGWELVILIGSGQGYLCLRVPAAPSAVA